jgi:hypothetical protein
MTSNPAAPSSSPSTPDLVLDGPAAVNGNGSANPLPSIDPSIFRPYLLALLPVVLSASIEDIESTLFDDDFDDRVLRFASEGSNVVYIEKTRIDSEGAYRAQTILERDPHYLQTMDLQLPRTSLPINSHIPPPPQWLSHSSSARPFLIP